MPLQVQLVSADRPVWEGEASAVTARTTEGELGILPGHAPLLGVLVEGQVSITSRIVPSCIIVAMSTRCQAFQAIMLSNTGLVILVAPLGQPP